MKHDFLCYSNYPEKAKERQLFNDMTPVPKRTDIIHTNRIVFFVQKVLSMYQVHKPFMQENISHCFLTHCTFSDKYEETFDNNPITDAITCFSLS